MRCQATSVSKNGLCTGLPGSGCVCRLLVLPFADAVGRGAANVLASAKVSRRPRSDTVLGVFCGSLEPLRAS